MKKNPDGCSINNDYVAMVVRNFVCRKAVSSNIIKEGKRKEGKRKRLLFTQRLLCAKQIHRHVKTLISDISSLRETDAMVAPCSKIAATAITD